MAGSWRHMTGRTGRFLNNENFVEMIENLGDAYEAAEECYGMVWWLARELTVTVNGGRPSRTEVLAVVSQAEEHYRDGLKLGGVQRGND